MAKLVSVPTAADYRRTVKTLATAQTHVMNAVSALKAAGLNVEQIYMMIEAVADLGRAGLEPQPIMAQAEVYAAKLGEDEPKGTPHENDARRKRKSRAKAAGPAWAAKTAFNEDTWPVYRKYDDAIKAAYAAAIGSRASKA